MFLLNFLSSQTFEMARTTEIAIAKNIAVEERVNNDIRNEVRLASNLNYRQIQLIAQQRKGDRRTFEIEVPSPSEDNNTPIPIEKVEVVEVIADRQEYDDNRQVITAEGNVVMRFAQATITSDRLKVNLADRVVVAQGNVILQRGEQILQGDTFEYYLVQDRGVVNNAKGQINRATIDRDLSQSLPGDPTIPEGLLGDRITANQPVTDVTVKNEVEVSIGSNRDYSILQGNNTGNEKGTINRVRFEAEKMEFEPNSWQATNLRLTNDPFSPPELELRANTATFKQTQPLVNELTTTKSRVVIDNSFSLPLIKNSLVFDGRPRSPGLFNLGFDGEERGGLYIERSFNLIQKEQTNWEITPQYFLQRALFPDTFGFSEPDEGGLVDTAVFGLKSNFQTTLSPRSSIDAKFSITNFSGENIDDNTRAQVSAKQLLGNLNSPHTLGLEFNFRERLFNGSLGFRTVHSSIGGVLTSPDIALGNTGINLRYQASIQNIDADTDRRELLRGDREHDRTNLTRYQTAVFLGKSFKIWEGKGLPPTKEEGLRYSPFPIVPYLQFNTGLSGVSSFYSNSDGQHSLRASTGIQGQLGHFSGSWLDYTGFNLTYSTGINADESPFLFDRDVDQQTLALGITQQIYGPIKLGVQTSFNIDQGDDISTDYILEYSRRTHNITLRYNPVLEIGSFSFRINDFNWRGNSQPFGENDIRPVVQGVGR